jgi:hypothetical protein
LIEQNQLQDLLRLNVLKNHVIYTTVWELLGRTVVRLFLPIALMTQQRPWHLMSGCRAAMMGEPPPIDCGAGAPSTAWEHRYGISEGAYR